ncbi:hypothetical protein [Streptomyces sp. Da 82-17]|uniref:hypothetical protein n=1 Tax=Streptomyces sp. Da 82-17 TaxID=3377116 RepID=UPI0038D4DD5E
MSTHTEQTTNTAADQAQGTHCWVMTLEIPGRGSGTTYGTLTPAPGWTRYDALMAIKDDIARQNPQLTNGNIMFFSIEPNQL